MKEGLCCSAGVRAMVVSAFLCAFPPYWATDIEPSWKNLKF